MERLKAVRRTASEFAYSARLLFGKVSTSEITAHVEERTRLLTERKGEEPKVYRVGRLNGRSSMQTPELYHADPVVEASHDGHSTLTVASDGALTRVNIDGSEAEVALSKP